MKKRIVAVCLTLVLLLCALPFAAAEDKTETAYLVLTDQLLGGDMHIEQENCTRLAVGDTIRVTYEGDVPADVIVNGRAVYTFPAGERNVYVWEIKSGEPVSIRLCTADKTLIDRSFTVISGKEMYRENLSAAWKELTKALGIALVPSIAFKAFESTPVPVGNPFLGPVLVGGACIGLFKALFSFTRL